MDANTIITLVGSLGFPIVAYGGLFWYMINQDERHSEEIKELREVVEKNTLALTKLCEKMGVDSNE